MSSINPLSGSTNGGTQVTINGNGFSANDLVKFDTSTCNIQSATINQIVCITTKHSAQSVPVSIK